MKSTTLTAKSCSVISATTWSFCRIGRTASSSSENRTECLFAVKIGQNTAVLCCYFQRQRTGAGELSVSSDDAQRPEERLLSERFKTSLNLRIELDN